MAWRNLIWLDVIDMASFTGLGQCVAGRVGEALGQLAESGLILLFAISHARKPAGFL